MKPVSPGGSAAKDANKINFEVHGTRTGVRTDLTELPKPGRFESLEQRFDGARSPDPADVAAGETTVDVEEERKSGESTRRPRPRANALKDPPLTLPGASKNKHIGPIKESAAYARARLLNCSISPSDMSTVSTAPPTPQFPSISHQETPVVTQGNPAESATATNLEESQSINSKSQDADSSDVDDELVPPPPAPDDVPEAPSQEHGDDAFPLPDDDMDDVGQGGDTLEMTDHRQEDSFTNAHVDVGLPSEIDAEENGSDDLNAEPSGIEATEVIDTPKDKDERPSAKGTDTELKSALKTPKEDHTDFGGGVDDDKEGEGFNMVHDPETPESVREERIQREEQEMAQNRKKKRGKKREPSLGDDNSESKTRVKPAKSKKNKKKVTINSPRGYPSGPRGYSVVPVDDLVETNETEGLRRSNRARTEPLEYWRNERFVYGANEEDREQGEEVMGNMPVVRSVLKACDTPYKKRKMPQTSHKNAKATNKKSRTGRSDEDDEETAFDARKLKKKYDFIEGENAMVWNDAADDAVDESKYFAWLPGFRSFLSPWLTDMMSFVRLSQR